ncbi:MAG TPA: hypothetical protein VMU12_00985 [Candidatus Paceibacterota bacterium]|nr:hypothetical protein [Candidatus Paceibacterota bacterium]
MPTGPNQHIPETQPISEVIRRPEQFRNVDEFNEDYIRRMAAGARTRKRASRDGTETDALRAIDAQEFKYKTDFQAFWRAQGMTIDEAASNAAWSKVRAKAIDRYTKIDAVPMPPAATMEQPRKPEQNPPAETTLDILDASRWMEWDKRTYSEDVFYRFTAAFLPELSRALRKLSTDMQRQAYQLEAIKKLYEQKLFRMYLNQYPDLPSDDIDATRLNIQSWLDQRWDEALARARTLPPIS